MQGKKMLAVAQYTFLEGVRARFFIGVVISSIAVVVFGAIIASVPYGRAEHLIGRIGWGVVFLTGVAVSAFYVTTTLFKEREARILNMMLAKPVERAAYFSGKFLGFYLLMLVAVALSGLFVAGLMQLLAEQPRAFWPDWSIPVMAITLKSGCLIAVACLFSAWSSTTLVAISATFVYFLLGAGSGDFVLWAQANEQTGLQYIAQVFQWLAPQFPIHDLEGTAIYQVTVVPAAWIGFIGYFLGYTVIALVFYLLASQWQELN